MDFLTISNLQDLIFSTSKATGEPITSQELQHDDQKHRSEKPWEGTLRKAVDTVLLPAKNQARENHTTVSFLHITPEMVQQKKTPDP